MEENPRKSHIGEMAEEKINTIYVMSKGRPDCKTAQMLRDTGYPGEWYIVCGDNDETLGEYRKKWGEDRVIVFNWREYVDKTDLLDPFGVDGGKPSGAAPARNAIHDISAARGEKRHWQLDDDFPIFYDTDDRTGRKIRIEDGKILHRRLLRVAEYGYRADILDIGVDGATLFIDAATKRKISRQVFGCHNLRSDDRWLPWRGRMADDIVQAIDSAHTGRGIQIAIKWFGFPYVQSAKAAGGNTDLYNMEGKIRKQGYANLVDPRCCHSTIDEAGVHFKMDYPQAKILHEKYRK